MWWCGGKQWTEKKEDFGVWGREIVSRAFTLGERSDPAIENMNSRKE